MDKHGNCVLQFEDYTILEIEFRLHPDIYELSTDEVVFPTKINHSIRINEKDKQAIVGLDCRIGSKDKKELTCPFFAHVHIVGKFSYHSSDNSLVQFDRMCRINATAILYPYLRSTVSDITRAANIQPVIMPVININKIIGTEEKDHSKE